MLDVDRLYGEVLCLSWLDELRAPEFYVEDRAYKEQRSAVTDEEGEE